MTATFNKNIGYNITFGVDTTGGSTYVVLAHIVDIGGSDSKTEFGDTTLLGDKNKTYLPASIEPGEFSFTIAWDPNDAPGTYGTLAAAQQSGALLGCEITVTYVEASASPATGTEAFKAYVANLGRKFGKKNLSMVEVKLQITGDPALGGS